MARAKVRNVLTAQTGLEVGVPPSGNYLAINEYGNLRLYGTATQYEDLRIDGLSTRVGSVAPTDETGFRGGSAHIVRNFVNTQADEVQFTVQLPHAWKEGSDLHPHVHFSPWVQGSASTNAARFILEYYWANVNEQFPATTGSTAMYTSWTGDKQWYHLLADDEVPLAASGKTLSSLLKCRLYRDNTTGSNLAGKVTFLYFDIHYEVDSLGSNFEYIKQEYLMAINAYWYTNGLASILGGSGAAGSPVDWLTDTINCALASSSYSVSQDNDAAWTAIGADEVSGTGYTASGVALSSKSMSTTASNNTTALDAADVSWPNSTLQARYAIIYKVGTTAANSPLLGYVDFGETYSSTSGTFAITWNAGGILTLSASA